MTKSEAITQMRQGAKVTHRYFSPDEFITMQGLVILDEKGYKLNADEFWRYRTSEAFNEDWELFKEQ